MRWPEQLLSLALVAAGVLHLLPLAGVLSASRLEALYGLPVRDPSLELLLRHRALLFGLLGALMIAGAFVANLRVTAIVAALISMTGFLLLAMQVGPLSPELRRVAIADVIATLLLLLALVLRAFAARGSPAP